MAETNQNQLLESVKKADLLQAKLLLDRGADPNYIHEEKRVSPMHLAAGLGVEPLCLLLQYNGDPNIRLEDGTTPVHIAAIWGFADCMQILLANGGDPFLRDQEGLTAEDLALQYQHDDILQVLRHYMFMLSSTEEETVTPMFTYKRLSVESTSSGTSSQVDCSENELNNSFEVSVDDSLYNSQDLQDYLQQFARRRRSSLYLKTVQKQCDKYFRNGQRTHIIDVTSPDHPYIERREFKDQMPVDLYSLNLSQSEDSSDSFVTCDGESLNENVQARGDSSLYDEEEFPVSATVKKNPKYCKDEETTHGQKKLFSEIHNQKNVEKRTDKSVNQNDRGSNKKRSGEYRRNRYCDRKSLTSSQSQSLCYAGEKCCYCGGQAEKVVREEIVCASCEKLGLELDELVGGSGDYSNISGLQQDVLDSVNELNAKVKLKSDTLPDILNTLPETEKKTGHIGKHNKWLLAEKSKIFERDKELDNRGRDVFAYDNMELNMKGRGSDGLHFKISKEDFDCDSKEIADLTGRFVKTHLSQDATKAYQNRDVHDQSDMAVADAAKLNDSIVSTISSTVNELDKAHMFNDSILTMDETYLDKIEVLSNDAIYGGFLECRGDKKSSEVEKNVDLDTDYKVEGKEYPCSQEYNDLWKQVQQSKHEKLASRNRKDLLDTAFCGRQSMSSIFSDASTIDYVYTDKENGITLVERHLPSLCGSQGSRRSVDSQLSTNTDVAVHSDSVANKQSNRCSVASEDTVVYSWRENAMLKSDGSWNVSSQTVGSTPLSQELLNLDNETLRTKLCDLGDDPGPVTKTTRQAYLRRLSQLQNDPDCRLVTCKQPEYTPELRQALNGNLDLSEMPALETKMVAAFQNPDRLRRWREGTLKSSFNYILMDPRVTKNLPNRAVNMSDQDVLQTFISATFYIGKGKRARPYCHLYEAIKYQKKQNTNKMSKKVEKILEIWNCGMGVVSLHCFQSVIPVEAYTREACMIDAIGLNHITNQKKGDYYGVSVTFSMKEKRKMGVYLLKKALQIFLAEGERQIAPLDIKND